MSKSLLATGLLVMMTSACGAASSVVPASAADTTLPVAKAPADEAAKDEPTPQAVGMPDACASKSGDYCLPSRTLAKALCHRDYPTVALAMFAKGTVWTRAYLRTKTRAWNASGGGSSNEMMAMSEEVLVLRHRKPKRGGMQVSGAGESFDVLRWDGGCVTLSSHELTTRAFSKPKNARIVFKRLERGVRDVLKKVEAIRPSYLKHRKECKGVSMGRVSKACEKVDGVLSRTLAAYVRDHGGVPTPQKIPGAD